MSVCSGILSTVNVKVKHPVEIREDFRIDDPLDGDERAPMAVDGS
jgi:hypothetical protein